MKIRLVLSEIVWTISLPWDLASALAVRVFSRFFRTHRLTRQTPWVIGGHRGRLYSDNAGALHRYICTQTDQSILWIANGSLLPFLRQQGIQALRRNSWRARLAILKAPVLITSHGEDDLDQFALFWRGCLGLHVHLNHSMNHLKAGQWYRADIDRMWRLHRAFFAWSMVHFDALLASSELERQHFMLSFPQQQAKIHLGGGAHIDDFLAWRDLQPEARILWFPTFRDTPKEAWQLDQMIREVAQHPQLNQWLQKTKRTLVLCHHINSGSPVQTPSNSCVEWIHPGQLIPELARCELFISDYSGLLVDWLIVDRPVLFFAFDMETYLQNRRLYLNYPDFCYGPSAQSAQELASTLMQETWMDQTSWEKKRAYWKKQIFPWAEPCYARQSYETICRLKSSR